MTPQAHAGSPWSPRQRYWLQALGHAVPRLAAAGDDAPVVEADEVAVAAPARAAPAVDRGPAPVMPRRRAPMAPAEADVATPAPAAEGVRHGGMQRPQGLPDRLQLAVLRASGLAPSDPRIQAVLEQWPSSRLRGDAAAKRALWLLLRALRRPA